MSLAFNNIYAWKQFLRGQVRTIRNENEFKLGKIYTVTSKYAPNQFFQGEVREVVKVELYQYGGCLFANPSLKPYFFDSGFTILNDWYEAILQYHPRAIPKVTSKADLKTKTFDLLLVIKH
jgi:hypothetical protein